MATYNYKDKGAIVKFGGGVLKVREVDEDGAYTSGDLYDLGYIQDAGIRFVTEEEDVPDETGQVVTTIQQADVVKLEGIFMQTNKSMIDFLRDKTIGKFYQVYYKSTKTAGINALTQEIFCGIVKIKRMIENKANTKRMNFEMTLLSNPTAISITTPNSVYGAIETDTVSIGAGNYFEVVEN